MITKMNDLLDRIAQLETCEMDDVMHAIRERFKELHPNTELIVASIPKDNPKERAAFYEWLIRYVREHEKGIVCHSE